MMNNAQTKKIPKTIKEKKWVANQEFTYKKLTCAKGQILPGAWQGNASLRKWLKEKDGSDCIVLTDMMIEQQNPKEILDRIKAKDSQIESLEERIAGLESKMEEMSSNKNKPSGRTRGTRRQAVE